MFSRSSRIRLKVRFDSVIDAVIVSAIFALYQEIVAVGGQMTKVGVHWIKVDLHLETLLVSSKTMHIKGGKRLIFEDIHMSLGNASSAPHLLRSAESGIMNGGAPDIIFSRGAVAYLPGCNVYAGHVSIRA